MTRNSLCAVAVALVGMLVPAAPARATTAEDTPPIITGGVVTPNSVGYQGDQVTITVDATDDVGIVMAYAQVYGGNVNDSVQLVRSGENAFSGTYSVPANYTDEAVNYSVEATVTDGDGQTDQEFIGSIDVDAQPQFDEPPVVYDQTVTPRAVGANGGTVTFEASASDLGGITAANATLQPSDGPAFQIELTPISFDRFRGAFSVPANTTAVRRTYAVTFYAYDDIGQPGTADGGTVAVAAAPASSCCLTVAPASVDFGKVRGVAHRVVTIRNTSPRGSAQIKALVTVWGTYYSIGSGDGTKVRIALWPGQHASVTVAFTPTTNGVKAGRLAVKRTDGSQAGLGVPLTAQGA